MVRCENVDIWDDTLYKIGIDFILLVIAVPVLLVVLLVAALVDDLLDDNLNSLNNKEDFTFTFISDDDSDNSDDFDLDDFKILEEDKMSQRIVIEAILIKNCMLSFFSKGSIFVLPSRKI